MVERWGPCWIPSYWSRRTQHRAHNSQLDSDGWLEDWLDHHQLSFLNFQMSRPSSLLVKATRSSIASSHFGPKLNFFGVANTKICRINAMTRPFSLSVIQRDQVPPGFENFGSSPKPRQNRETNEPPKRKESSGPSMDKKKSDGTSSRQ
jgi:hypothetical protein